MAGGRIGSASGLNVFIDWTSTETSITANLYLYNQYRINTSVKKPWSITINGNQITGSVYLGEKAAGTTTHLGSHTVYNLAANTNYSVSGICDINMTNYNGNKIPSINCSGTATTEAYKYANLTGLSIAGRTSSSVKISFTSDRACKIYVSITGGASWLNNGNPYVENTTGGTINVTGLSANTNYTFTVLCRDQSTGLDTSKTVSATTYAKTTPTISLSSKTSSSITVTSGCNVSVSSTQYRIKTSSGSYGSYQTSGTFSGLSANTTYTIEVKKVGSDSGESGTATLSVTTYQTTVASISLSSKTSSSITVTSSCNVTVSSTQYRIKTSSGSYGNYQTNATFSGLSANTTYVVEVKKVGQASGEADTATVTVTTYAKTTPTISLSSKSVNSITVTSNCNVSVSSTQYRIKTSSGSYGSYQTGTTFSNLSPNTAYVVEVKKVGTDSGESGTATLSVTTYNIATMSAANNFNLGDSHTITYTNPMGSSVGALDACLSFTGELDDIGYRAVSKTGTSYTYTFTDAELDKLYKKYGTGNTITATSYLRTTHNSKAYHSKRDITITLTGNQKTGHTNVNNSWKRGKIWTNVNGTWKRAVIWTNVNGTWKRTI